MALTGGGGRGRQDIGMILHHEWPWLTFTAMVDIVLVLIADAYSATGMEKVQLVIAATSLLAIIRLLVALSDDGNPDAEVLLDVDAALLRARAMQNDARETISAMWTLFPYDDALKDYFRKTLAQNVYTRRLIDTAHAARADIADHLWESRESIASGNYRVYLVNNVSFEVLIVDHGEAAVFHYPRRGFSCLFARHQERQFVTVVHGIFEQLCEQSTPLPDTAVATKASLDAWLHANG